MRLHPLAGKSAPADSLIDVAALKRAYHELAPNPRDARQRVSFGTSGHRGNPFDRSFNEAHTQVDNADLTHATQSPD